MKKLIHIAFGLALVFGMSSCEDYLDVNTDPDNPVSETVSPQLRLPWIQNYYAYAWGTASMQYVLVSSYSYLFKSVIRM